MNEPPPFPAPRPLPVQPLGYSVPLRVGRPGILTAMGVMSIVVASLSALASLSTGFQAVGFYFMTLSLAAASAATPATPTPAPGAAGATTAPATAPAGGVEPADAYTMSVTATAFTAFPTTQAAPAAGNPPLTAGEVQAVIQKVQARCANRLTPAQVAALQAQLQAPNQTFVTSGTVWSPVQSATVGADGSADLQLTGGFLAIDAQGTVTSQFSTANPFAGMAGKISPGPFVLVGLDAALSLGLAVLLMIAGIMVFASSPKARALHRIYAVAKIPVAVVGAVGFGWLYKSVLGGFPGGGAAAAGVFTGYAVAMGLLGVAYPVGVLVTLRARSVRAYYASAADGP